MQTNTKKTKAVIILLALVSALTVILSACVPNTGIEDESIPPIELGSKEPAESIDTDESTPEGYTEKPKICDVRNITAEVVVIAGTCEDNAVVTIKSVAEEVTVQSKNGHFIAEVNLSNTTTTMFEATAIVEGKERSEPRSLTAKYNATAEKRKDKYSVSIGTDSQLYFDSFLENFNGENLLTQTQLRNFKSFINKKVANVENRADGQDVELIYVLVPDVTTIYPEILPEDVKKETNNTRYKQISEALSQTNAALIDMYDVLMNEKDSAEFEIFRRNDSHLTEYGAFLVYQEIANKMSENFPEAAPRKLDEFTKNDVDSIGGDYMTYLGMTNECYKEKVVDLEPQFDLKKGYDEESNFTTVNIDNIKKYNSENDYSIYSGIHEDDDEDVIGINDRINVRTNRPDLPSALIYRDDSVFSMIDILAERFNNAMIAKSGDYTVNLTDASRHNSEGKSLVDYIIVVVSESNVEDIMK